MTVHIEGNIIPGMPRIVKLLGFHCERCEYEWVPRNIEEPPRVCPKCKSPYWDRPRQADLKPRKGAAK